MHLIDIRGWFASDYLYPFDFMYKSRLRMYASKRCVQVNNLTEALNASKAKTVTHVQSMELKFLVVLLGLLSIGSLLDRI